ncbi:MFS transporter [Nocardioides ginkgobilobae]
MPSHREPPVATPAAAALPGGRRQVALVALVQVLGLAVWFSATAIAPTLRAEWGLSTGASVWLTASVQLGFATGAVVSGALTLADRVRPERLMAACALGAAACTATLALVADGLGSAVPLRFLTGALLAGLYPVGMKLTASWARPVDRGRAFGLLIGCLTLGSALPHLVAAAGASGGLPWRAVMLTAAGLTVAAGGVSLALVRPGPLLAPSARPRVRHALVGFRDPLPRLANLGYLGHMWELYALWTWLPLWLAGARDVGPGSATSLATFGTVGLAGLAGALAGGWAADRWGRSRAATGALLTSGACCLLSPWAVAAPTAVLAVFLGVWGASVIADSGVFSTALSETADQRYVGTALTVQTAAGFTLTVASIQLLPLLADRVGWTWVMLALAPGPLLGAVAMLRFGRLQRAGSVAART